MNQQTKDQIINDLIRNRPKGPGDTKIEYSIASEYCYRAGRYKNVVTPMVAGFGYQDEQFFDLGFRSKSDVEGYIRNRDFEGMSDWNLGGKKATLTRRVNRLWERIEDGVSRVLRKGGVGIYNVKESYYSRSSVGHLYAESMEEAQTVAKIYFGYLVSDSDRLRIEFVKRGTVSEMKALNAKLTERIDQEVQDTLKRIEQAKRQIEMFEARKQALATVEAQQTAVEMVNYLDAVGE